MLTTRCNFRCQYCFGQDFMGKKENQKDMSQKTYLNILEWLNRKSYPGKTLHLMGGEPTLHSQFVWFAKHACEENFNLAIFSNAATPNAFDYAKQLVDFPIRWVVNVNPPNTRSPEENRQLHNSLDVLKENATLTFNIMPSTTSHGWILDLIERHSLAKRIKIGLVLPTLSHQNRHLQRDEYPQVSKQLVNFAHVCSMHDISLEYECGIEMCTFSTDQLGMLWHLNAEVHSSCNSILDITPDGRIIYCLPLADFLQARFDEFENILEAKEWFEKKMTVFRPLGNTKNCVSCSLLNSKKCRGGCLARILGGVHNIHNNNKIVGYEDANT
ncbi:MAG: radical SAM protein [Pseudomonadota bacterium]